MEIHSPLEIKPAVVTHAHFPFLKWLLIGLIAIAPAIVTYLFVTLQLHANLLDFVPSWNDEVSYWHQTLTLRTVGFNGGYYTLNERIPAAPFIHFYTHGPWYPLIYGTMGFVTGWNFYSPVIINFILVGGLLALFAWSTRMETKGLVLTLLHAITFWPMLLYVVTAMQESMQQAIAIILALIFYRMLSSMGRDSLPRWQKWAFYFVILFVSIIRLDWGILFFPYFIYIRRRGWTGVVLAVVYSMISIIIVMMVANYVGAPGNNIIFTLLSSFSVSISHGITTVWEYFLDNVESYFNPNKDPLDWGLTLQTLGLVISLIIISVWHFFERPIATSELSRNAFHLFNLAGIILASLFLYIIGTMGDYRVISVHLMLTILLLIAFRSYRLVALFVLSNVLLFGVFQGGYERFIAPKFIQDRVAMEDFGTRLEAMMPYDADAPTSWCNTFLFRGASYTSLMNEVPAGIGHSFYFHPDEPKLNFYSRYLLLTEEEYNIVQARGNAPPLELVGRTGIAELYINRNVECD